MMYEVDARNIVVDVDAEWDVEAGRAAGSEGLSRDCILGRPLESFMVGDATKMFVRSALDAVRLKGQTRVLPYRCDVPGERRYFEMVMDALANGHVGVSHRLVKVEPVPSRQHTSPRCFMGGWLCSQCRRVRLIGTDEWAESEHQFDTRLLSDVCPDCTNALFDNIK